MSQYKTLKQRDNALLDRLEKEIKKLRAEWSNDTAYTINETLDDVLSIIEKEREK